MAAVPIIFQRINFLSIFYLLSGGEEVNRILSTKIADDINQDTKVFISM